MISRAHFMLKLGARQPEWVEIMAGVRILFAAIDMKAVRAARRAAGLVLDEDAESVEVRDEAADVLSGELIRRGILDWSGVGDVDGKPVPVTPENIAQLLSDPMAYEACEAAYVGPYILRRAEGNVSSAGPTGTGPAATRAKNTARSAVVKKAAAKNAPTPNTPRKRTTAKH
jgi:hypothetical protein